MDYGDLSHTRLLTELSHKHSLEFEFREGRIVHWERVLNEFLEITGLSRLSGEQIVSQYMDDIDVGDTW